MAVTKTLIGEARTFGGGWVGDVRSAVSRRLHSFAGGERTYGALELSSPSDWDQELVELDLATYDPDDDDDPYGLTAWWERD